MNCRLVCSGGSEALESLARARLAAATSVAPDKLEFRFHRVAIRFTGVMVNPLRCIFDRCCWVGGASDKFFPRY